MKRVAIYAGSFDPLTNGHIDVLRSSFNFADKIIIAIGVHPDRMPLFTFQERIILIQSVVRKVFANHTDCIEIISFDNLLVEKAREIGASLLVRGLRDSTDFDYEMQLAGLNSTMEPSIQTIFLPASVSCRIISATLVRQIAAMGGDVSHFVPETVACALNERFNR